MKAKVIHTEVTREGVIHVVAPDLPPGEVDIIILVRNLEETGPPRLPDLRNLPLGGYRAGWLSPEQLRREAIYEDI